VILFVLSSCGPKTTAALQQFVSCAESAAASDIEPDVQSILARGATTWAVELEGLALQFGVQTVNCAVSAAKEALTAPTGSGTITTSAESPALARAVEWLQKHGGS
jgi:hypothetical protein